MDKEWVSCTGLGVPALLSPTNCPPVPRTILLSARTQRAVSRCYIRVQSAVSIRTPGVHRCAGAGPTVAAKREISGSERDTAGRATQRLLARGAITRFSPKGISDIDFLSARRGDSDFVPFFCVFVAATSALDRHEEPDGPTENAGTR